MPRRTVHPESPPRPVGAARAVAAVAPAVVLVIAMVAAVNLAVPLLQAGELRPSVSGTAWIVDSYTLVFACLLIPAGALGDRFGRKRGMLIGLVVFAVGSALAAVAPSVALLMCGRALSGVGAALVLPATLAVTLARLGPAERPRGVALWSALTGAGGAIGNLGGGLAIEAGGWRALFWAGVPLALGAAALIAARVPASSPHRDPVDGIGAVLLTAGSVALLYGIIGGPQHGWGSPTVLGSLAAAAVLLTAFARHELRATHPMLDPRLLGLAGVRSGALGIVALFFVLFGLFYINAQYLQDVKGYSALLAGVCILPLAITMPWTSARSPGLAGRIGARATVVAGMLVLAAALLLLSFATAATPYALYGLTLALVGAGMGLAMPPLSQAMVQALPPTHAGVGAGLNSTTRELGSALGVAVFSTILASRFAGGLPDALHGERSLASALQRSAGRPDLRAGARDAFTSGTGIGLRVGVVLLLLATVVVFFDTTNNQRTS